MLVKILLTENKSTADDCCEWRREDGLKILLQPHCLQMVFIVE